MLSRFQADRFAEPAMEPVFKAEPVAAVSLEEDREEVLAAVEAFLERTKAYQLQTGEPTEKPLADAMSVSRRNIENPSGKPLLQQVTARGRSIPADIAVSANARMVIPSSPPPLPAKPVVLSMAVKAVDVPTPTASTSFKPAGARTANQPLDVEAQEDAPTDVGRFLSHLESQTATVNDFESWWRLRLMQLAFNRDAAINNMDGADAKVLSPEGHQLFNSLLHTVQAVRSLLRNPMQAHGKAISQLEMLRRVVAEQADPQVSAVAMCRKVVTFGVYEEMSAADFVTGRNIPTIVYFEVRHFRSEPAEDGQFLTRLGTRLEVLTAAGESVWQHEEPDIEDRCRRRRTDFFIAQRITLPSTLPAGDYVLKVLAEDKLSDKGGEAAHPFTISSAFSSNTAP